MAAQEFIEVPSWLFTPEARKAAGRNLKMVRERKGLSRGQLARWADVDDKTLQRIERGLMVPTSDTLVAVTNALGISLSALANPRVAGIVNRKGAVPAGRSA